MNNKQQIFKLQKFIFFFFFFIILAFRHN